MSPDSPLFAWLPSWQLILPTAILLVVGSLLILTLQHLLKRYMVRAIRYTPITPGTALFLRRAFGTAMWVVLLLLVLRHIGVNVDGLWAILVSTLAVVGVGLLAVWTMVSNITASLFIWIWRPYELGEHIELLPDEIKGRAVDRSLMFTSIREADGSVLMVPNNLFFQRIVRRAPHDGRMTEFERWETDHAGAAVPSAIAQNDGRNRGGRVEERVDDGGEPPTGDG